MLRAFLLWTAVVGAPLSEKPAGYHPRPLVRSERLDRAVAAIAKRVLGEFAADGLSEDGLAITLVDLKASPAGPVSFGSFRGEEVFYPASTVKLFYDVYYQHLRQTGSLADTPELRRAVRDMITVSSNDASGFVVDSITETTSGPEIASATEWAAWQERRNAANRFFWARGYAGLNANQKTFCEDAYGRDQAFQRGGENRNRITANLGAQLMKEIALGEIVGRDGTAALLPYLWRDLSRPLDPENEEATLYGGRGLPPGTRIWCKVGHAYDVRHSIAWVKTPAGGGFVLAVMTRGPSETPCVLERIFELAAQTIGGGR